MSQSFFPLIEGFASVTTILDDLAATPDTEAEVIVILGRLDALEAQLDTAGSRLKALDVGSIRLNNSEHDQLWTQIRRWRRELSILVGIPLRNQGAPMMVI